MSEKKLQVTSTISASPEAAFALLADPDRHTELDGAGMLRGLESGPSPVTGTGDAFVMNMNQEGLGDYRMRNEITVYEAGRKIGWAPALYPADQLAHLIGDLDPSGHQYIWELEPADGGGTRVTHIYDWSGVKDEKAVPLYPRVSAEQMAASIERLGTAAAG